MVVHMLAHLSQPALVMLNVSDAWESPLLTLLALIDLSLLRMNVSAWDHNMATFDSSLDSSRFQTSALSTQICWANQPLCHMVTSKNPERQGLRRLEQRLTFEYINNRQTLCRFISSHPTWWPSPQWVWPGTPRMWKLKCTGPISWFYPGIPQPQERKYIIHITFDRRVRQPRDSG